MYRKISMSLTKNVGMYLVFALGAKSYVHSSGNVAQNRSIG
jgi:hypothetical protein